MSMEQWQIALRRQFAADNLFQVEKTTGEIVFADYLVSNPQNRNVYKVALRSAKPGFNFCSCFDFKISQLGTCKHIEAVFHYISQKRLKRHLKNPVEREYTSVYLDYGSTRTVRLRIGTAHQEAFIDLSYDYFDDNLELTAMGLLNFEKFLQKARSLDPDFRCYDDAMDFILEQREHRRRVGKIVEVGSFGKTAFFKNLVHTPLFPYQEDGVIFAYQHGRAIIGDEMGLGKTPQAIAAAELFKREHGISKVLILCPTSLKYQWKTEITKLPATTPHCSTGGTCTTPNTISSSSTKPSVSKTGAPK
jgi:hypothetical protein